MFFGVLAFLGMLVGCLSRLLTEHGGANVQYRLRPIRLLRQRQRRPVLSHLGRIHRRLAATRQRHKARD
jgi:hypothetical protein